MSGKREVAQVYIFYNKAGVCCTELGTSDISRIWDGSSG
jgi:hypothetical protein